MNEERISLAHFIKKRREDLGISQKEVAEALSYSPQAISRLESIGTTFPLEILGKLCRILDISVDDLAARNLENPKYQPIDIPLDILPSILKQVRESHQLTQAGLAKELGLTYRSIHNYESGDAIPTWKVIESICLRFDYRPSYLLSPTFLAPARKKFSRKYIGLGTSFASFLLAALIIVPLAIHFLAPRQTSSSLGSSGYDSTSFESPESIYVSDSLSHDSSFEHPVLTVYGEKNEFSYIGETLHFQVVGLTDDIDLSSYYSSSGYVWIYSDEHTKCQTSINYGGSFSVTLKKARPGTFVPISIRDPNYGEFTGVSYLYYGGDELVEVECPNSHQTYSVSDFSLLTESGEGSVQISEDDHEFIHFWWDVRDQDGNEIDINPLLDLGSFNTYVLQLENFPMSVYHREWFVHDGFDFRVVSYDASLAFYSDGICHRFVVSASFQATYQGELYDYYARPAIVEII